MVLTDASQNVFLTLCVLIMLDSPWLHIHHLFILLSVTTYTLSYYVIMHKTIYKLNFIEIVDIKVLRYDYNFCFLNSEPFRCVYRCCMCFKFLLTLDLHSLVFLLLELFVEIVSLPNLWILNIEELLQYHVSIICIINNTNF